jgi:hypothetical protein
MTPDLVIKHEEIIFSDGLGEAKRTIVHHNNAVHKKT